MNPLQPFVDSHSLAGAVTLVADKNDIRSLDVVGFADIALKMPMRPDTLFWIASQTKPITATALMTLVDEGKLTLDDPVAKYLPEFTDLWVTAEKTDEQMVLKKPTHAITVREILSHTAGAAFASFLEQPTLDRLPPREAMLSYAMTPLLCQPGTEYHYSNIGINIAGQLIAVLSEMPYAQFLQTRLFDPLGMNDTCFVPSASQLERLAKCYKPNATNDGPEETTISQLQYPLNSPARYPMPAGGLFSTANDVARFCRMILNGGTWRGKRYVSEDAIAEMTRKQTGDAIENSYGLGWSVGDDSYGHGGACATDMTIDAERGLVLIYLVQHVGFPGNGGESGQAFRQAAREQFDRRREDVDQGAL